MLEMADPAVQRRIASMIETIELRTGRSLSESARDRTEQNLLRYLNQIARLNAFELVNADEPDFVFSALREES